MNRAVLHYINKYLSDYLENISSDQLEVSLFSGKISMENVRVKSHVLQLIGLPFDLKFAKLGKINISYYFSSILSKPITIEISEILAFISPVESTKWSQSSLKDLLIKAKQMSLDQFENLLEAEIEEANIPGFLKRWLLQIIDNVQISIEKLYIRYEDSVTGSNKFNFGILLKSLKASTCDFNWEKTLTPKNQSFCYKSFEVNSFAVFNDFDVETTIFQNVYKGELEEALNLLIVHEVNGEVKHNYIIEPFSINIKAQINKALDKNAPLINLQVEIPKFFLSVYDGQIASGLHVVEFVKLFLTFMVGVDKTINCKVFTEEEEKVYSELYAKYRKAQKNNKTRVVEKLKKKLIELEVNVKYENIVELRTSIISSIVKTKLIKVKEKEINKINSEFKGKWAKFKSAFQRVSELEFTAKEQEVASKIDEAIKQIDKINENSVVNLKKQKIADNWLKVFVEISIGCVSACMYSVQNPLVKLEMESIKLALGLKSGVFIEFNLASTRLIDLYNPHPKFPYFFDMGKVWMYLEDVPLKLEFTGGDIFIYCLTNKILNIASILKNLFVTKADISTYALNIEETYREYLESGKDYLNVIFKDGQAVLPDLKVNCKAPVIVFPGNLEKTNDYVVINSGKIVANTLLASQSEVHYYFELRNFEIFIMSSFNQTTEKKELIISLEFLSCSFLFNILEKHIKLGMNINDIVTTLNPRSLRFLNDLQRKLTKVIPKIMIVSNVITEDPSHISKKGVKYEGIPVFISFNLRKVYLIVIEQDKEFFEIGASKVYGQIEVEKNQHVKMEYKVKEFYAKDLKHATSYLKFFSDPYPDDHDYQINLKILINPETKLNHLSISVNSIRIIIYSEFIESLLKYYNQNLELLNIPVFDFIVPNESKSFYVNTAMYLQMGIICHKVEVWFPSKQSSDCVAFELAVHMDFKQTFKYRVIYSASGLPSEQVLTLKREEMEILASHMSASLIKSDFSIDPQLFLLPFRAYLQLESNKSEIYPNEVLKMKIDVNVMEFIVELQQVQVFVLLGFDWLFFFMPGLAFQAYKKSELLMDLDVKVFDCTLISKTDITEYLCKVELRNSLVNITQNGEGEKIKCKSVLGLVYNNRKLAQWQTVIEKVPVFLDLKQNKERIEPDVRIYENFNINLTYELIELGLEMVDTLVLKKVLPDKELKKNEKFVIQNFLDKKVFVWLAVGKNEENLVVGEKNKLEIDWGYFENLKKNSKVAGKWTYEMELAQASLKIGLSYSENRTDGQFLELEEVGTRILKFAGQKVVVENSHKGNLRFLSLKCGTFIVDFSDSSSETQNFTDDEMLGYSGNNYSTLAGKVNINNNQVYCTEKGFNIVVQHYEAFLNSQSVNIIEIHPEHLLKNSIREKIQVLDELGEIIQEVEAGSTQPLKINANKFYFIQFSMESEKYSSSLTKLITDQKKKVIVGFPNHPGTSLVLKTKRTEGSSLDCLKGFEKRPKKNNFFSQITELYSEYLLNNSSQMDLNVSGLVLNRNCSAYFSDLDKVIRIKSLKSTSQWSVSFKINTVGLAGMINTRDSNDPESLLSVKISQLEGHTKLVRFAPRFLMWNLLSIQLYVSDDLKSIELPAKKTDQNSVFLDTLNDNRVIKVSFDKINWSEYFKVDEINDFQIRFKSEESESEEWYLPGFQNNFHRVLRVIVNSQDEAVINLCFMNPVDPDFRIVNKTEDPLFVSQYQSDSEDKLMIPPFEAKPWAWPSHTIHPKLLIVDLKDKSGIYSLDKIKSFKKKPISDCSVSVIINGSTRELWVKGKSYSENKSRNTNQFFVVTNESSEHQIVNPRFAIKGLVPLPELIDTMQTNILKHMAQKQLVTISAFIGKISINLYSPDLSYLISATLSGLHAKGNLDTYSIDNKNKISSDFEIKLKALRVFSIESRTREQENILLISPGKDQEFGLILKLKHEVVLKACEIGLEQRHKIENFDLDLGTINVSINEQSIYSLLSFLEYYSLLKSYLPVKVEVSENFSVPSLGSGNIGKVYIKSFKLSPIKILISIKKAKQKPDFSALSKIFFYPMLRMVGSTFLSEKEVVLDFKDFSILNVFQTFEHFGIALSKQYITQGIMQFYVVLGFFDLIVNPVKLFESIGTTVFDYFKSTSKNDETKKNFAQGLQRTVKLVTN